MAVLGEVRAHDKTGLLYIYEFHPSTGRPAWLRFDTWTRGALAKFPNAELPDSAALKPLNRAALGLRGQGPTFARLGFQ